MDLDEFKRLVTEAYESLPAGFRKKIENVAVEVEDRIMFDNRRLILGQYHGVPLTSRTSWYGNVLPDKIIIYKGSIERIAQEPEEIKKIVAQVIRHEVGHYFGLDEADLENLGE